MDGVAPEHIRGATVEARSDEHCQENHVRQHLHAAQGRPTDVMAPETPRNSGANRLRAGGAAPGASCQRADPSSMAAQPAFRCSLPSPLPAGRDPHRPPRQRPFPPFLARQPPASAALADAVRSACRPGSKSMHSGPGQLAARAARFRTRAQWSSAVARLHSAVTLFKQGRSSKRVVRPPASMGVSGCDAPSRPRAARSVRFNLEMSISCLCSCWRHTNCQVALVAASQPRRARTVHAATCELTARLPHVESGMASCKPSHRRQLSPGP